MRALIVIIALALAACALPTSPIDAVPATRSIQMHATLSTVGTFEHDIAADYTRLASSRSRAASLLRASRISPADAIAVQSLADRARGLLDAAVPAKDRTRVEQARAFQVQINSIVERAK